MESFKLVSQSTHWTLALMVYEVHPAQTRVDKEVVLAHGPTTARGVATGVPYSVQVVHTSFQG